MEQKRGKQNAKHLEEDTDSQPRENNGNLPFPSQKLHKSVAATRPATPSRQRASYCSVDGGKRLTSGASTPKGASMPRRRVSREGRGREANSTGAGSSERQSAPARWIATERMPQYWRARQERNEARSAGAA